MQRVLVMVVAAAAAAIAAAFVTRVILCACRYSLKAQLVLVEELDRDPQVNMASQCNNLNCHSLAIVPRS